MTAVTVALRMVEAVVAEVLPLTSLAVRMEASEASVTAVLGTMAPPFTAPQVG